MESANHQHQEHLGGSSSFAVPSINGAGTNHLWSQNLLLNSSGNFNSNINGINGNLSNSRDLRHNSDSSLVLPSISTSMFHDLGLQWPANADNYTNHFPQEPHAATKIKEELSDSFSKYSDLTNLEDHLQLPSTSYLKHDHQFLQDLNEKLLVKNLYSGCQINSSYLSAGDFFANPHTTASIGNASIYGRGNFSRILPSTNISSLNPSSSSFSSSLGMNLQALDLLEPRKFGVGVNFIHPSHSSFPALKESAPFDLDHLQESSHGLSNSSQKISFTNGETETRRVNANSELKPSQAAPKKPRMESRSSFPPFKVRKEKLGDRIAALQQLVAPFGKTDTASVLMEAIGYIKFLQDQIETLSVPYMKSSGNSTSRPVQGGSGEVDNDEEPKRDLRSRGLCLVPLSCTSYVTNENGGMWSPPNFSGGS